MSSFASANKDRLPLVKQSSTHGPSIRRILGLHEAELLAGPLLVGNLERTERLHPQLGRNLIENSFGGNGGSTIGRREWAMLTLSVLIAIGDTADQLKVYVGAALKHGATEGEILELISHASGFIGAPRAVNGLRRVADMLIAARDYELPDLEEKIVRLEDHDTLVRDSHGEGIPIVLIHALSMDGRMWKDVFPRLASGARVISYDLRGHGQARAAPLTISLDHLAGDLRTLLNVLGIEKADIYGASYGGGVAQHFALAYPDRVRSLALIATTSKSHQLLKTRAVKAEEHGMESLLAESIIRWFLPETIATDGWMVRYARACVRKARVEDWAAAWRAMADLDCIDRMGEIQVPVQVLAGVQDASTPPPMMKRTFEACKHGEYRELNPGTHMMAMEQAGAVAVEFAAFRERVDKAHGKVFTRSHI